jgi:hypothetical protein
MDSYFDSTDRSLADYFLFALAFLAFMLFVWGILLSSPAATLAGALILLVSVLSFQFKRWLAA